MNKHGDHGEGTRQGWKDQCWPTTESGKRRRTNIWLSRQARITGNENNANARGSTRNGGNRHLDGTRDKLPVEVPSASRTVALRCFSDPRRFRCNPGLDDRPRANPPNGHRVEGFLAHQFYELATAVDARQGNRGPDDFTERRTVGRGKKKDDSPAQWERPPPPIALHMSTIAAAARTNRNTGSNRGLDRHVFAART